MIQLLKRPENGALCVETAISHKDFQEYWNRSKEKTSSSISGLHFGHWKAAIKSAELSEIHSLYTEIAISSGYAPLRWMKALTVMLEKKPGVIVPDKLRAITLLEADLNGGNKLILGNTG